MFVFMFIFNCILVFEFVFVYVFVFILYLFHLPCIDLIVIVIVIFVFITFVNFTRFSSSLNVFCSKGAAGCWGFVGSFSWPSCGRPSEALAGSTWQFPKTGGALL